HPLHTAGEQRSPVPERVGMGERPFHDVGDALDVGVGVHRPLGAGREPVVVEDAERAEPHLLWVAVPVEREVPSGPEPAAILRVDVRVASDLEHVRQPSPSSRTLRRHSQDTFSARSGGSQLLPRWFTQREETEMTPIQRWRGRILRNPDEPIFDQGLAFDLETLLDRRRLLQLAGLGGLSLALAACSTATSSAAAVSSTGTSTAAATDGVVCSTIPEETAGPYPADGSNGPDVLTQSGIVRRDIRSSFGDL